MKLATLLIFKSVICLACGAIFVIVPGVLLAIFGVKMLDSSLLLMSQLYGAAFLSIGVVLWLARNDSGSEALRAIVIGVTVGDGVAFVVALMAQLGSAMNGLGWLVVAIYGLFSLGFGYLYFQGARPSPNPA